MAIMISNILKITFASCAKRVIIRIFIILVLFLILGTNTSIAQNNEFKFKRFSVEQGLSQSTVFCITQDSKGFMWFGTRTGGLNKFDGHNFTHFKHNPFDSTSISGNQIISLFEDSKGRLWIGTRREGLNLYNNETNNFQHYSLKTDKSVSVSDNSVIDIIEDNKGRIWIGTDEGLYYYDENENTIHPHTEGDFKHIIHVSSMVNIGDRLWLATKDGIYLFSISNNKILKHYKHENNNKHSISSNNIIKIHIDFNNRLWAGTRKNGLSCLIDSSNNKFIHFKHSPENKTGLLDNFIRNIYEDKDSTLWISTGHGLDLLSPEEILNKSPKFSHIRRIDNDVNSLSQNSIHSFYVDKKGNYWIGTWGGGVNFLNNETLKFKLYKEKSHTSNSLNNNTVNAFCLENDSVWIGTNGGGLNLLNRRNNTFKHYKHNKYKPESLRNNNVRALVLDNENTLWIGTTRGLNKLNRDNNTFELFLDGEIIYSITEGIDDYLWIGTEQNLYKYNKKLNKFKTYISEQTDSTSLSYFKIKHLFKDKDQNIWVGTEIGLNRYNREQDNFEQYLNDTKDTTSLSNNYVTSISDDNKGNIWIGTYDGLNLYNNTTNSFIRYGKREGLPYNDIENILSDNHGNLWITSSNGLSRFTPVFPANKEASIIKNYKRIDGLQNGEFRRNSSHLSTNGEMFFGGTNGFNIFHPDSIADNTHLPNIAIIDFKLFNETVINGTADSILPKHISATRAITLNHKQSVFSIEFVAINFIMPEMNNYAYKLEGFDKNWNYIGNKREATYTSLPSGNYTFKVKASNIDGVWNNEAATLQLKILPPWWKTWIFRLFMILIAVYILYQLFALRIKVLKDNQVKLEKLISERTIELQEANHELTENHEEISHQKEELLSTLNQLQNTQTQLVQYERMASVGILASGIAHEINNPLNHILCGKTILESFIDENLQEHKNDLTPSLKLIEDGVIKAADIVQSLSQFRHSNENVFIECNMHEVIDNCLKIVKSHPDFNITINKDYTNDNFSLKGIKSEFHQLMLIILTNAEQAIENTGTISITTNINNETLFVIVKDTGCGIDHEDMNKITLPFFTTKDPNKGTGLGLSIAFNIVQRHLGDINFESKIDKGTTVTISLPLS